ncbi:helix-turn-helix domain-containing protein [Paenibacillus sp. NPDC058071]|uniref:helix-turn-helix domain-containing protein n=1 Tax=Paenibacillus sp. NPDC058071 TaxID=3346326 RepID=UPI0036DBF3B2
MNSTRLIDFSKSIGVSQGTLSEIEQNKYYPSTETIMAIHTNFHVDIQWNLFG